jgi:hypothetical protein
VQSQMKRTRTEMKEMRKGGWGASMLLRQVS